MTNRSSGFYWIRTSIAGWEVAYWEEERGRWNSVFTLEEYTDESLEIKEIDESPLTR